MAGSWNHMTTRNGQLLNTENFHDMLENGGDVYEAAEECFGMIWWLATALAGASRKPGERAYLLGLIREARDNHQDGLELGGRQEED